VQDRNMIAPLLAIASKRFPSLEKAIADGGYQGKPTADDVKEQAGIPLEIVKRSDAAKGFYVLPKRWRGPSYTAAFTRAKRRLSGVSPAAIAGRWRPVPTGHNFERIFPRCSRWRWP